MQDSVVHFGDYGCGFTKEKAIAERRGARAGKAWHQSLNTNEIADWFVVWGIIGRHERVRPINRFGPFFDRGPGIGRPNT